VAAIVRVLIFDPHDGSRTVTRLVLTSMGYECTTVGTMLDALGAIDTFEPDVVIYEWNLRSTAGYGVAARMRAASRRALRIIVVSALDEPEGFSRREGADAYFTKPARIADVELAITAPASTSRGEPARGAWITEC
jgi:DNA-binding response OmpR family regulator